MYDFTLEQLKEALTAGNGFIVFAAKKLGVSRQWLSNKIDDNQELKEHIRHLKEGFIDLAEQKLFSNVNEGKEASIFFTLKTIGKNRGFVERQEITGPEGSQPKILIEIVRNINQKDDGK